MDELISEIYMFRGYISPERGFIRRPREKETLGDDTAHSMLAIEEDEKDEELVHDGVDRALFDFRSVSLYGNRDVAIRYCRL